MTGSRRKYFDGSAKVNVTMPTPMFERLAKIAHDRSKDSGRLVSKSDLINEAVQEMIDGIEVDAVEIAERRVRYAVDRELELAALDRRLGDMARHG